MRNVFHLTYRAALEHKEVFFFFCLTCLCIPQILHQPFGVHDHFFVECFSFALFFFFFWSFQIFETDWIRKPESIYHFTTKPSAPVEKSNTSLVCHECRFWQKFKKIIIKKRKYNLRMKRKNLFKIRQQQAVEGCSCGLKSTGIWVTHTHTPEHSFAGKPACRVSMFFCFCYRTLIRF